MGWWKDLLSCHQFQSFSASVWLSESLNIKQLYFQVGSWRVSRWSVKIGNSCSWVMLTLGIIGLHSQGNTNSPSTVDRQDPQESPRRCSDKSSSTSYGSSGTWSERWLGCTCRYHSPVWAAVSSNTFFLFFFKAIIYICGCVCIVPP